MATAAAVAVVAHALGLAWGSAWVSVPRRTVTVLRAESLVNDGTALVLYGLAVGVTVGEEHPTGWHVTWLLVLSYGGGLLAGGLVGLLSWRLRGGRLLRAVHEPHRAAPGPGEARQRRGALSRTSLVD